MSRGELKIKRNLPGWLRNNHVGFPQVLIFGLGISKTSNTIFQNFHWFVLSQISWVKKRNLENPGIFSKKYLLICQKKSLKDSWKSNISRINGGINLILCESPVNWVWSDMVWSGQINSKFYIKNILTRQKWSSFFYILHPHKQRLLWNHCPLLVDHCSGWSVQHFSKEPLINFLLIFSMKLHYLNT